MNIGAAIVLGSVVIGTGMAISGVVTGIGTHILNRDEMSVCWQKDLVPGLSGLATQIALPRFKDSLPPSMSVQDRARVIQSFSVSLSNLEFTGESGHWGTVKCGATIAYSYNRPDGTAQTFNKGNVISYTMHPWKGGWGYEMSGASIPMLLISYTDQ